MVDCFRRNPIRTGRDRVGYLLAVMCISAVAVCCTLATTQNTSQLYETETIAQIQRAEQMRWLALGVGEWHISACARLNTGAPSAIAEPPTATVTMTANQSPSATGFFTAGPLFESRLMVNLTVYGQNVSDSGGSCSTGGRRRLSGMARLTNQRGNVLIERWAIRRQFCY